MRLLPALALLMLVPAAAAEELVFDVTFNDTIIATGSEGFAIGDRVILDDVLSKDGAEVGSTAGVCTITDTAGVMHCAITFALADGTLSTQFLNTPPPEKRFGLFGGTGRFDGKAGSGVLVENGDGTGKLTLTVAD